MADISLFEAMHSQRSIHRFTPDPVSDEEITTILRAAVRAPSGGNSQPWHFLVVRDRDLKRRIGEYHGKATLEARRERGAAPPPASQPLLAADWLAQHMEDVPVLVLACVELNTRSSSPDEPSRDLFTGGANIYPAIQNLMLAARGLGLGTALTTRFRRYEREIKELLGIPANVEVAALIPMGHPGEGEHFGGSRRKPVKEVTFYNRWGQQGP